jgi:hypothetical protein
VLGLICFLVVEKRRSRAFKMGSAAIEAARFEVAEKAAFAADRASL